MVAARSLSVESWKRRDKSPADQEELAYNPLGFVFFETSSPKHTGPEEEEDEEEEDEEEEEWI